MIADPAGMAFRRPRLFSGAVVLIAIATALLCALMPLNMPVGGTAGSAFNPANTVVTIHAQAATRAAIKRLVQGDDVDGKAPLTTGHDAVVTAVVAFDPPAALERPRFAPKDRVDGLPAAPRGAAWPRGPPQA